MNVSDFWVKTKATFKVAETPNRPPDYTSYKYQYGEIVGVSSEYWYTASGVYRRSNHWSAVDDRLKHLLITECGKIGQCHWVLRGKTNANTATLTGFCPWRKFRHN